MGRECQHAPCHSRAPVTARYCSEQCRRDAGEVRNEEKHIRRIYDAAKGAPRAEPCRECAGGYYSVDQDGDLVCACARRLVA